LKALFSNIIVVIISLNTTFIFSQEWKNLTCYQKETGHTTLQDGCWLKKDRKRQNAVWQQANTFNLTLVHGNRKYTSISQIKDFYLWFDSERKKQGHEIKGIGIAAIAASQLSKVDIWFIRCFIVRNKEVVNFVHEGSDKVFEFAFPLLNKIYFSKKIIKGNEAINWSLKYGEIEQCEILEPLYQNLSPRALQKLNKMAKGKGIFKLGVPHRLKYEGRIEDCQTRFEHATTKLLSFYLDNHT